MSDVLESDEVYLQVHGLTVKPEHLNAQVVQAIDQMRKLFYGEPTLELTEAELHALQAGGFNLAPELKNDPAANAAVNYAALLATSLETTQTAKRLGVKPTRVRQMLAERSLYGIRLDGRWHIPAFQFWRHGLVPQIGKVIAALDPALHPLAVLRWFTLPNTDLETPEGKVISPVDWLLSGGAVHPVVAIARHV